MTKQQIEKKYKVKLEKEMNPHMSGRYFWSVRDESGKEIERCETLDDVAETLRIVRWSGFKKGKYRLYGRL